MMGDKDTVISAKRSKSPQTRTTSIVVRHDGNKYTSVFGVLTP